MPYYRWKGINLLGNNCSGIKLACNEEDLAVQLVVRDVGLIKSKKIVPGMWWQPLSSGQRAQLFRQCATLLDAGIYIDQVCEIIKHQVKHQGLKKIMEDVHLSLNYGTLLSGALEHYPSYFSAVTIHVIASGQESGTLVQALYHLADYYDTLNMFSKKIRSALVTPLITFIVFFVVATIIFMVIIPGFSSLFTSVHTQLPYATQCIMNFSDFLRIWFVYIVGLIVSNVVLIWYCIRYTLLKRWFDRIIIQLPFIGSLIKNIHCLHMCNSLSLLMQGGVQLVPALALVAKSFNNECFIVLINALYSHVEQGKPLPNIVNHYSSFFPDDVQALISVGYEANCLPLMLTKAGLIYQQRIDKTLSLLSTIIQPLLMIILGLLITGLIFALYMPIFNLSFVIY